MDVYMQGWAGMRNKDEKQVIYFTWSSNESVLVNFLNRTPLQLYIFLHA